MRGRRWNERTRGRVERADDRYYQSISRMSLTHVDLLRFPFVIMRSLLSSPRSLSSSRSRYVDDGSVWLDGPRVLGQCVSVRPVVHRISDNEEIASNETIFDPVYRDSSHGICLGIGENEAEFQVDATWCTCHTPLDDIRVDHPIDGTSYWDGRRPSSVHTSLSSAPRDSFHRLKEMNRVGLYS